MGPHPEALRLPLCDDNPESPHRTDDRLAGQRPTFGLCRPAAGSLVSRASSLPLAAMSPTTRTASISPQDQQSFSFPFGLTARRRPIYRVSLLSLRCPATVDRRRLSTCAWMSRSLVDLI